MTAEEAFSWLGLANNLLLILLFQARRGGKTDTVRRIGRAYILLAMPGVYVLLLAVEQGAAWQYLMFLAIFLAFLALYYAMNYGFVVMVWERSLTWGFLMLTLLGIQLIANLRSHFPKNALA